ncbi:MAG: DUF721 domain-containing protein [Nitrospirota bacterium]|nr:MAG: DUF721 domain-containing protein [Nitrospirota bacterium]
MERLSKAFEDLIRELGIGKAVTVEMLRRRWNEIVGDTISGHTDPDHYKGGKLVINVDSAEWLHELQYYQTNILSKLEPFDITSVRFKLGRIRKKRTSEPLNKEATTVSDKDREFAQETSSAIKSDQLKNAIRKAIERSLGDERS